MNVYIDESGIFKNPAGKQNIVSCVGALCIPSCQRSNISKDFNRLKARWGLGKEEVKGSKLGELEVFQVVRMLKRYEVVLELVVNDLGLLSDQQITDFKLKSAGGLVSNLTPQHLPETVRKAHEWREAFENMPNNLFVQTAMMNVMIPELVQKLILYYARRIPKELGSFHWVVDAKDKVLTPAEKVWSEVIFSYIYSESLKRPLYFAEGGDYSHFEKHTLSKQKEQGLAKSTPAFQEDGLGALATWKILGGGFKFQDSKTNYGLQLADILVNAVQRAFNGKLQKEGWEEIGALVIACKPSSLQFITFDISVENQEPKVIKSPFSTVMNLLQGKAKPLWTEEDRLLAR